MLLDIGALDSIDCFASGSGRCVVATEDEDKDAVRQVLWSSGFREEETDVMSYSGASKADAAIVLGRFLKDKAPNVKMVVHRDRDYLPDDEVEKFEQQLKKHDIRAFVTGPSDIEGYYLSVDHICKQHPSLGKERVQQLVDLARTETRDLSLKAIVNLRTEQAFRRRKDGASVNHGEIAVEAQKDTRLIPREWLAARSFSATSKLSSNRSWLESGTDCTITPPRRPAPSRSC